MSSLEKIQKGMRVFQILSKIVLVFAVVGVVLTSIVAVLVAADISLLLGGIITLFVYRYFTAELKEGTPFTSAGADRVKQLGIITIVLSVISVSVTDFIYERINLPSWNMFDDSGSVMLGICLLLLAMVIRYGAELEQKAKGGKV